MVDAMTDAEHLIRAAAWLRAFPHLPTMRPGMKHEHAQWAETLERLAARLPRMVEIAPEDAKFLHMLVGDYADQWDTEGTLQQLRSTLRAHAAGVDASARFRARADRCDPVEVPVLAAGVDAPCLVCHLPDGQHRMSCYQRYRDAREKAERVAVEAELRSPVGPAAHAIGGNESPRAPIDLAAEASDGGAFGPVSDWLSKVPSIKRESLGTWRANDCAACEGSGYANVRASAAGARTCPACKGTGRKEGTDA